jgi:hypothetical protein
MPPANWRTREAGDVALSKPEDPGTKGADEVTCILRGTHFEV